MTCAPGARSSFPCATAAVAVRKSAFRTTARKHRVRRKVENEWRVVEWSEAAQCAAECGSAIRTREMSEHRLMGSASFEVFIGGCRNGAIRLYTISDICHDYLRGRMRHSPRRNAQVRAKISLRGRGRRKSTAESWKPCAARIAKSGNTNFGAEPVTFSSGPCQA